MLRPRRTVSRASARAALATAAALICLGLAVTATSPMQRGLGLALAALGAWQAWREFHRRPPSPTAPGVRRASTPEP